MSFNPGDIVQLKSGGPAMTVTAESPEGVHVIWYGESNDEMRTSVIPGVCLEVLVLDDDEVEDEDEDEPLGKRGGH